MAKDPASLWALRATIVIPIINDDSTFKEIQAEAWAAEPPLLEKLEDA